MDNANIQTTLFGAVEVISPRQKKESKMAERKRKMRLVYSYSGEKWKAAYEAFILNYAERHPDGFIAETCRLEYESRSDLPQLTGTDKRASGQIFTKLSRQGKLIRIGYGHSVERSSPMPKYTLAKAV